jgi:NAD(P)-dependent dehydrogenase (short-subunit alcohol dehydrogenase family)
LEEHVKQVAVITGAARGIGRAVAQQLAGEGYAVIIADLRGEAAAETAQQMRESGLVAVSQPCDVTDPDACGALIAAAVAQFGQLDVLVNSAGVSRPCASLEVTPEDWRNMVAVQLDGVFFCSQAAGRQLVSQGQGGCIVNISSINAEAAFPRRAAYCAAKAGVQMLTKTLAIEWARYNIRVNAVGPSHTATEMTLENIRRGNFSVEEVVQRVPLGRLASVQDVANAVSFLVSDRASFITGHSLYVDGGYLAYGYL